MSKRRKLSAQTRAINALIRRQQRRQFVEKASALSDNEVAAVLARASDGVLRSAEWRDLRRRLIERHGAKCMRCGYVPEKSSGINVDHIKPRKLRPDLAFDESNLQILCARCNRKKGNQIADYRGESSASDAASADPHVSGAIA